MNKKLLLILTAIVMCVALLISVSGCSNSTETGESQLQPINITGNQQGIWVNGEGKVTVTPNIANLSLGVTVQAATVAQAQSQTITAMNAVMAVLTSNGVAAKDIQTQNYSIQQISTTVNLPTPSSGNSSGSAILPVPPITTPGVASEFQVSNTVSVIVRAIDTTGTILDDVTAAGGDLIRVNSVSFAVDQPEQYYPQARQLAMTDAANKAGQLAKQANVTLGKATYISDNASIPIYNQFVGASVPAAKTSISPGQTDITIDVQVAYAIK